MRSTPSFTSTNADELHLLLNVAAARPQRPRVALRVNLDAGIFPQWDRFGFNLENGEAWQALGRIVASERLELVGLHCHIDTYVLQPAAYGTAATKLAALALRCQRELATGIQYLDLGGGFPSANTLKGAYLPAPDTVPSLDKYAEAITGALLAAGFKTGELPMLVLEAGRALVDDADSLIGTVLANKRLADGRRATILDFGVNLLFISFWYDHHISPTREFSNQTEPTVLYGPLCMNINMLRESIALPLLGTGDHVVVHKVGAYNLSQWQQFINLRPNVVLICGGLAKTDSEKSYLPLPMTEKLNPGGMPATRKKYTPAFKAEGVRQVAAGARQTDVARAHGISPALLGRWQRQALEQAVPSSAEREEIKRPRAELRRVEMERDILKKAVTIFSQPLQP